MLSELTCELLFEHDQVPKGLRKAVKVGAKAAMASPTWWGVKEVGGAVMGRRGGK